MNVKKSNIEDYQAIADLDQLTGTFGGNHSEQVDSSHTWRVWVEYALVYQANAVNGELMGAIVAFPVMSRGWCIHKILLHPEHFKPNTANILIDKLLDAIDHREEKAFIMANPDDSYAIKLYEQLGFKNKGLKENYYGEGEHRIYMKRPVQWADVRLKIAR